MHLVNIIIKQRHHCLNIPYNLPTFLLVESMHHYLAFIFIVEIVIEMGTSDGGIVGCHCLHSFTISIGAEYLRRVMIGATHTHA